MHIRLKINDMIIKKIYLFLFVNMNDRRETIIKYNKSINNGEILRLLETVIILNINPFNKLDIIKNISNK